LAVFFFLLRTCTKALANFLPDAPGPDDGEMTVFFFSFFPLPIDSTRGFFPSPSADTLFFPLPRQPTRCKRLSVFPLSGGEKLGTASDVQGFFFTLSITGEVSPPRLSFPGIVQIFLPRFELCEQQFLFFKTGPITPCLFFSPRKRAFGRGECVSFVVLCPPQSRRAVLPSLPFFFSPSPLCERGFNCQFSFNVGCPTVPFFFFFLGTVREMPVPFALFSFLSAHLYLPRSMCVASTFRHPRKDGNVSYRPFPPPSLKGRKRRLHSSSSFPQLKKAL